MYPNSNRYLLENMSFTLEINKKYALVGENASCKSTILKLLLKLYTPTKGKIYINDININNVSKETTARLFSCDFQGYYIYPFTIRENVALGNLSKLYENKEVIDALNKSGLYKDLNCDVNLNELILKQFSNTGLVLLGGQNQKLLLFIAHRLSNVVRTDNVLLLKDGKIDAIDSHLKIFKNNQYYHIYFFHKQRNIYKRFLI